MKFLFVGDVMLVRLVNDILRERPPVYPLGNTLPIFQDVDVRICNLECVISQQNHCADGFTSFYPSYSTETQMNADFVVMVRQTHHERHCILSLSKDQSNDYQD